MQSLGVFIFCLCVALGALGHIGCKPEPPTGVGSDGVVNATVDGQTLERTRIVASLDVIPKEGENIVWCASFTAAWKEIQNTVFNAPVMIDGADDFANALNDAKLPPLPDGSIFAKAGIVRDGIQQAITDGLRAAFPDKAPPVFNAVTPEDVIAYAYLELKSRFTQPYIDNEQPLTFTASDGTKTEIRTFGVQPSDRNARPLRKQPQVLYLDRTNPEEDYFAVDLCTDCGETQVVFARLKRIGTLQDTLQSVCRQIRAHGNLEESQTLLAPQMVFKMLRNFDEIMGRTVKTPGFEHLRVSEAMQDIDFSLTKEGVELKSEAIIHMVAALAAPDRTRPPDYICDRPFVIFLKKRGTTEPFFVLWIQNDELLTKW